MKFFQNLGNVDRRVRDHFERDSVEKTPSERGSKEKLQAERLNLNQSLIYQEYATKKEGLDFIFDKASGVQMLYANQKYDKTFEVMEELSIPLNESETNPKGKPNPNK
jgi:hypothetical protein